MPITREQAACIRALASALASKRVRRFAALHSLGIPGETKNSTTADAMKADADLTKYLDALVEHVPVTCDHGFMRVQCLLCMNVVAGAEDN